MKTQQNMLQLYDRFQQGEPATNPKHGNVLGSIGAWNGSDVASAPVGRILQQAGPPFFAAQPDAAHAPGSLPVKTHADVARVVTDDPAVYMDLQAVDGGHRADGEARLRVFSKGKPIEEPVTLQVQRF